MIHTSKQIWLDQRGGRTLEDVLVDHAGGGEYVTMRGERGDIVRVFLPSHLL